jgi:excisionase family DNA binding protein
MSTDIQQARLLTVRETASLLAVTRRTVRCLIAAGVIPALQLGPPGPRASRKIPPDSANA